MSQCTCNGCGGYNEWKAQQEREMQEKRDRFEAWLAAREQTERSIHDEEVEAFRNRTVAA